MPQFWLPASPTAWALCDCGPVSCSCCLLPRQWPLRGRCGRDLWAGGDTVLWECGDWSSPGSTMGQPRDTGEAVCKMVGVVVHGEALVLEVSRCKVSLGHLQDKSMWSKSSSAPFYPPTSFLLCSGPAVIVHSSCSGMGHSIYPACNLFCKGCALLFSITSFQRETPCNPRLLS